MRLSMLFLVLATVAVGGCSGRGSAGDSLEAVRRWVSANPDNTTRVYQFSLRSGSSSDLAPLFRGMSADTTTALRPADVHGLAATGNLELTPLGPAPDDVRGRLAARLTAVQGELTLNGVVLRTIADSTGADGSVLVAFDERGAIEGITSPPTLDPAARMLLMLLLASTQVVLPDSTPGAGWSGREPDPQGVAWCAYRAESASRDAREHDGGRGLVVSKRRQTYEQAASRQLGGDLDLDIQLVPDPGDSVAVTFDEHGLRARHGREQSSVLAAGRRISVTEARIDLDRTELRRLDDGSFHRLREALTQSTAGVPAHPLFVPEDPERLIAGTHRLVWGRTTWGELLRRMERIEGDAPSDTLLALYRLAKAGVGLHPETGDTLLRFLDRMPAEHRAIDLLGKALSETGGTPAEMVLIRAIERSREPEKSVRLIHCLATITSPGPAAEQALVRVAAAAPAERVRAAATLGLGTLAYGFRYQAPARASGIVGGLVTRARTEPARIGRLSLVLALGNAGHPDGFPVLVEALADSGEPIRGAAAFALRFIEAPETDRLLLATLEGDTSPNVRARVIAALEFRPASPAVAASLKRAMTVDRSERVVIRAMDLLWNRHREDPEVRPLVATAANRPEKGIREAAERLLARP